jgi:myosin-5
MWNVREGDFLLSVNELSASAASTPFETVMRVLDDGVRPAVLRFRRPSAHELPSYVGRRRRTLSLVRAEKQQSRARLEKALCHVIWREEDGALGIQLKPDAALPYPIVSEVHATGLIGRGASRHRLRVGDALLTINHYDVQQLGYKRTVQVMQFAPKPLVLTFRCCSPVDTAPRTLDL